MTEQDQDSPVSAPAMQEVVETDEELLSEVAEVEQQLRTIRRDMLRVIEDDQSKAQLTAPQMQAMIALFQAGTSEGLTLKELSERMGLAHSTVSGIVDRLERRGMVSRQVSLADRRVTRIVMTNQVRAYIEQRLVSHLHGPLLDALRHATRDEREAILTGLSTLRRLLAETQGKQEA
ncbi:MAG TPA: MarR family transcriptional regulator [Ktedonobacteraceae bacterium]|jgi:DNA-binding MarR family transcriptional regulator|nr:MarR family transcriptional regulator [Ktedonobacteraceae bacterium]